jgi:hypothetical protein
MKRRNVHALRALARKQQKPTREGLNKLAEAGKKIVEELKKKD